MHLHVLLYGTCIILLYHDHDVSIMSQCETLLVVSPYYILECLMNLVIIGRNHLYVEYDMFWIFGYMLRAGTPAHATGRVLYYIFQYMLRAGTVDAMFIMF